MAGPERLEVGDRIQRGEPRDVGGGDELQVRELVAGCRPARSPSRAASSASRASVTARSPSAWKCTANPAASIAVTYSRSATGSMNDSPRLPLGAPFGIQVVARDRGREVLGDPVDHDLDDIHAQPRRVGRPRRPGLGGRSGRAAARARDPAPTTARPSPAPAACALGRGAQVDVEGVRHPEPGADHRVLPARDAEREQLVLGAQQPAVREVVVDRAASRGRAARPLPRAGFRMPPRPRRARCGRRRGRGCDP